MGKFTSPHLIHRHDCVSVNGHTVDLGRFQKVEQLVLEANEQHGLGATEFEVLTAVALEIFRLEQVDVAVVEVGLGGRLDATNVLPPARLGKDGSTIFGKGVLVTGITKIGVDHEGFLGSTPIEIARHKAGIIKPGVTNIVDGTNSSEVLNEIALVAIEKHAHNYVVTQDSDLIPTPFGVVSRQLSPLKGNYQLQNLSLSLKILEVLFPFLQENYPFQCNFSLENIQRGIQSVQWPGRLQTLNFHYDTLQSMEVLLDGAHNTQAAQELSAYLNHKYGDSPVTFIIAITNGKDVHSLFQNLVRPQDRAIVTQFGDVDGMPWIKAIKPQELKKEMELFVKDVIAEENVQSAMRWVEQGGNVVICGSLYLVGEVLRLDEANR